MSSPDRHELLALARSASAAAEQVLVQGMDRRREVPLRMWSKSSSTDLATEMDTAAEQAVVDTILAARPHDVVLGEEGGDHRAPPRRLGRRRTAPDGPSVRWVVDPLDGTINYIYGLPHWAVSIAAQVDGVTVVGVVSVPMMRERFTAVLGEGAWWGDDAGGLERLEISAAAAGASPVVVGQALVATGFGYAEQRRREQAAVVAQLLPAVRDIRRLGAAAIDLCHVASGRVDAYFERGLQPWDLAAGELIAREAGVRVEGFGGAAAGEQMVIAAGPGLFEELHALLAAASGPQG